MEILEQIDSLVESVENRMRQLSDENRSLRDLLELEREKHIEERSRMEQKLGALLPRLRAVLDQEGQGRAG